MSRDDEVRCELVSWSRVHDLCRRLAGRMREDGFSPEAIVAIARGGFAPARLLCDYLRVMDLTSLRVVHYQGVATSRAGARIVDPLARDLSGRRVLVVDDVSDTGDTFDVALEHMTGLGAPASVRTAVLLHKTTSRFIPDYFGARVRAWRWMIFPWARVEDVSGLIAALPGAPRDPEIIARALRERHGLRASRRTLGDALRFGAAWSDQRA